jgi:predicted RNA binding protein YcfA (HicA-like mRNA interferase family)
MLQISAQQLIKVLLKLGFVVVSQKGSHIKLRKNVLSRITIIVPNHKTIRPGTLNNILKAAGLTQTELKKMIK